MSPEQNHHYLPQNYQRGWVNADGRVRVCRQHHNKIVCDLKPTKSTGGRPGLYHIPMAPPERRNYLEDVFWKRIDQWGDDGLKLLRTNDPQAAIRINLERLAIYILSLGLRNPREIAAVDARAKQALIESCLAHGYGAHRQPHQPATFEEFKLALDQPGLSEVGAYLVQEVVLNAPIRKQMMSMDWQVVTVPDGMPILTSDAPLIRHRGLKNDDGMFVLPISANEFLVVFNHGDIDMVGSINKNIQDGVFVEAMNKYVVRQKIDYVYGVEDSEMDFVRRHWTASDSVQPILL